MGTGTGTNRVPPPPPKLGEEKDRLPPPKLELPRELEPLLRDLKLPPPMLPPERAYAAVLRQRMTSMRATRRNMVDSCPIDPGADLARSRLARQVAFWGDLRHAPATDTRHGQGMTPDIHPQTLLVSLAIEFIAMTLVTVPAWRMWPASSGMARWSIGNACLAASMGLLSQRGVAPGLLTVVLANGLLIFGAHCVHVAVRRIYDAPPLSVAVRLPPLLLWLALALIWAFDTSPQEVAWAPWRVAMYSGALAWTVGGTLWVLARRSPRPWTLGTWYVFIALMLPVAGQLARIWGAARRTTPQDPVLATSTVIPLYAAFAACGVFMTYGFFLLINQRLQQQLEDANARLREDASTDPLTRVANRRRMDVVAAMEIARAHRHGWPLSLMLLDIDHFKRVNDTHGHAVGDQVLRIVADACERHLRGHDLVARIGGEEFVVLLPHSDLFGAEVSARRLLQEIRDLRLDVLDGATLTVSIGLAALGEKEMSIHPLLSRADAAMYRAKAAGRDRVAVDDSVTALQAAESPVEAETPRTQSARLP